MPSLTRRTIRRPQGRRAESVKYPGKRLIVYKSRNHCAVPAGFCILLGGLPKGCRLPGRVPATLTLTLIFDLLWFASWNQLHRRTSSIHIAGAHVTRAAAPARRATFASSKVAQKRLPSLRPAGSLSPATSAVMSAKTRSVCNSPQTFADDHHASSSLRSALLNGRAGVLCEQ